MPNGNPRFRRWLAPLGLNRPELRAWAMYDWANSAFTTTVVTAVFPIYFHDVAAAGLPTHVATARFAGATTLALLVIAVFSPILGAYADYRAIKKKMLAIFVAMGVLATAGLFFVQKGDWLLGVALFVLGNIGIFGSYVFYDSLLPHITSGPGEMDRVSTAGYGLGYLGGGLLLAVNLLWILKPEFFGIPDAGYAARLAFLSVAIWWGLFSIPLFRRVPEPARQPEAEEEGIENPVKIAFIRLSETFRKLKGYRQAFLLLIAFMVYNDGIATIYRMATIYGREIGLPQGGLIGAILMVQFIAMPFAFLFGGLAGKIGAKRAILLGLTVYLGITVLGYFMQTTLHFYLLATLVAMVQGGTQALSRSLFASLIPRYKSSEFFGFFAVFEKFAAILGPAIFAVMITLTGSSRLAVLSVMAFFLIGGLLLAFVNVEEGRKAARQAESDLLGRNG